MQNIKSSINIVKSGVGNIGSILRAIDDLYYSSNIVNKPEDFNNSKKIICPGVGNYDSFMSLIKNKKLFEKF
jgi:imidazole glycerol-phosphate synthase subunit HisH